MSNNKNRVLVKNIASLGIVQIVNYLFPLITIPYVSRIIGPDGFGTINYITAFVSYFVLLVGFGFDFTATRKIALNPGNLQERSRIYSEATGSRFLLFFLSCIIFSISLFTIKNLSNHKMLSCILFLNVLTPLITPQYIYQGMQRLSVFSFITLIKGIISTVLIFALITKKEDLILYAAIGVFSNFLMNVAALAYVIFVIRIGFKFYPINHYLKVLKESRFVFFSSVIFSLYTTANIIILGFFDNNTNIGYYTTAISFITIIQSIINIPLATSLYPFIGRAFSNSKEDGIDKLRRILPVVFYFSLIVSFILLVSAPLLVRIIYGDKFLGSVISVRILSFLPLLSSISGILGVQTMLNMALDKLFLKVTALASLISILLNLFMAQYYSYVGTSISYLITEIIIVLGLYFTLKKRHITIIKSEYFAPQKILLLLKSLK